MRTSTQQFIGNVGLLLLAAVAMLTCAGGQVPSARPPIATATINGTVTTQFGGPVPRARVTLRPANAINEATNTATDATGRFSFPDLRPGLYFLRTEKSGYSPAMSRALPGYQVKVASRETAEVALQLKHAAVIVGRVLDENGDPVHATINVHYFESLAAEANVGNTNYGIVGFSPFSTVYAHAQGGPRKPGFAQAAYAETDDRGEFRIHSLPPGRYFLRIDSSANGKPYAPLYYPAGPPQGEGDGFLLQPGDEVPLNFTLQPVPSSTAAAPPSDHTPAMVSGRVVSADGQPLAQAQVRLACGGSTFRRTMADGTGRFELTDIPPGGCQVDAFQLGYAPDPRNFYLNFQSLTPGERVEKVQIKLHAIAAISGRILDENGEPLEGAEVVAFPMDSGKLRGDLTQAPRTVTDERGRFRIHSIPPGQYTIGVNVPATQTSGRTYLPTYYPGTLMPQLAAPVSLRTGEELPIQLLMRPLKGATVRGRVISMPNENFAVVLEHKPGDKPEPFFKSASAREATVKPDNTFELANVPPGKYEAKALGPGSPRVPPRQGVADVEVALKDVDGVVLTLADPPGAVTITGTVRCECPPEVTRFSGNIQLSEVPERPYTRERLMSEGPAPMGGTQPGFVSNGRPQMGGTQSDMTTFTIRVPVGRWRIGNAWGGETRRWERGSRTPPEPGVRAYLKSATLGGRDVTTDQFEITQASASLHFDLLFKGYNGARIDGVILDPEGKPVVGAGVVGVATDESRRTLESFGSGIGGRSNWKGEFTINGARPGEYQFFAITGRTYGLDYVPVYQDEEWLKQHASAGRILKIEEKQHYNMMLHVIEEAEVQ